MKCGFEQTNRDIFRLVEGININDALRRLPYFLLVKHRINFHYISFSLNLHL